jgi:hypothetical protein
MTIRIACFVFIVTSFLGCGEQIQNKELVIEIEKNISNFKNEKLSDFAYDIEYIPLETNEANIINDIHYVDFTNRLIFINDNDKCLLFTINGEFVSQIGKKGKGPGEYTRPSIVRIGRKDNCLYVPDGSKILRYDMDGNYIRDIKNPAGLSGAFLNESWIPTDDSVFVCHIANTTGQIKHKVIFFNDESDTLKMIKNHIQFYREKERFSSDDGKANFYFFDNQLSYKSLMNDTLYRIAKSYELIPAYVFDLGKFKFPDNYRALPMSEYYNQFKKYIWIYNIIEVEDYIFLEFVFNDHYPLKTQKEYAINGNMQKGQAPILGVYFKKKNSLVFVEPYEELDFVNPNGIKNDIDGGLSFFPKRKIDDSTIVMWFNAYEIKHFVESRTFKNSTPKYPEKKKELERLANSLDENDNPVLMLVKLKE